MQGHVVLVADADKISLSHTAEEYSIEFSSAVFFISFLVKPLVFSLKSEEALIERTQFSIYPQLIVASQIELNQVKM